MPEGGARPAGVPVHVVAGERARSALAGGRFADVRWVATTGSTNADAMDLARDGAREGTVVVADHQTAGRGRRSRTWVAPPGGSLLVSVLLRPPARVAGAVGFAAGLAMAEAVEEVAGVVARLKWPNDLVVETPDGERKLSGLLAEADWPAGSHAAAGYRAPRPDERLAVVVGIGVNVDWPRPDEGGNDPELALLVDTATALSWLGAAADRVDLLVSYLRRLARRYGALVADGPAGLLADWRARSATLGRRVRVDLGADDVEGTAVDVTGEGHLVVETLEGGRRTLAVGDVVHLRPL
ncbi:MAG TPA: biotin--[acetyl-CoA-carboxylase] ligase [Acidimicrobiales bacterium]|nr:biotin--[acetyl-CoA-carboxylase] ligase [Acidimicrobiales bacterium]